MNKDRISIDQVNYLIRSRRSVFPDQFEEGRQIPDEVIWGLLENANWAPNHKHTEPWRFQVFTGDARKRFAGFQAARYKENIGERFKQEKYDKLLTTPLSCSHIIAIICRTDPEVNLPEMEEIAAVACAVQNIYLSLAAYGIGGYWSTGGMTYDPAASGFLGLGEEDRLMGFFYLGYVRVPSVKGKRGRVEDKTIWVSA